MERERNLDISFIQGEKYKPLIIFVHGIGMDKCIWTDPERSKVLAGRFPFSVLLGKKVSERVFYYKPEQIRKITLGAPPTIRNTLFKQLSDMGYPVIAWSQRRPASHAMLAVDELQNIADKYAGFTKNGILLIGHSRGGLIARRYAVLAPQNIKAVISIASPFRGSSLARWADIISRTMFAVNPFFRNTDKGTVKNNIKQVLDFINSTAVKELLPGSEFLCNVSTPLSSGIKTLNIAGTSPTLFRLYSQRIECVDTKHNKYKVVPKQLFLFPDSIKKLLPEMIVPEELKKGRGDGLVSKRSALSNDPNDTGSYPFNHAALLFAESAQKKTIDFIKSL